MSFFVLGTLMKHDLKLDRDADAPLYRQISDQLTGRIEAGSLPEGSRLPTVRQLASDLGVTRVTVHNAYVDLQKRGWIEATVGRGTFVSGRPLSGDPREQLKGRPTPEAALEDMHRLSRMPGVLSMAMADPDVRLLPATEFMREIQAHAGDAASLMSYSSFRGDPLLRQALVEQLSGIGVETRADQVLVTAGGTQALSLIVRTLAERGDRVLVEEPTYLGLLAILRLHGVEAIGVPMGHDGPDLEALEHLVARERPRFFYTIPTFQNPTGVSMPAGRRADLMQIVAHSGVDVVEDDVYRPIAFEDRPAAPLKATDPTDRVTYVGSFSKPLLPGLRVGYLVAPDRLQNRLASAFEVDELCGPQLLQRALATFVTKGRFSEHLERVLPEYRRRRDAMLAALERHMPEGVGWTRPGGGFCCWVSLPEGARYDDLYWAALQRGIAFTPGEVFLTHRRRRIDLRLTYSKLAPARIDEAVSRLADLVHERLEAALPPERPTEYTPIV